MAKAERGPRRLVDDEHRELFEARTLPWADNANPVELSAVYRQHLVALAVNIARRNHGWTIEQLADHVGNGAETLRRKLRGEAWISWQDASLLALAFPDIRVLPEGNGEHCPHVAEAVTHRCSSRLWYDPDSWRRRCARQRSP